MQKLLWCRLWLHRVVIGGIVLSSLAPAPSTPAKVAVPLRPALELRKVLNFLLEGQSLPDSGDDLASVISAGLKKRLTLPPGATPVMAIGTDYPNLQRISIDFSDAAINSDRRVPRLHPLGPFVQMIRAREFNVTADPMNIDGGSMRLQLSAQDVDLGVQRDSLKNRILVFTSARQGSAELHTTAVDLGRIFRASANARGQKYGLNVSRAIVKLTSDNEHQLKADLRLISTLVFLPVQIHFTARVDVDDRGMAKLTNLTCDGDDLAGWLISGMIQPTLSQYNGKTMPLVTFPSERVRLRDLNVKLDGDNVRVMAAFGS